MSAVVKLSSKLPGDFETNGIDALADDLLEDPLKLRVAVIWFDSPKSLKDNEADTEVPVIRLRRIEPLGDADEVSKAIQDAVGKATEQRTGRTPLPFGIVSVDPESRVSDHLDDA